MRTLALALILLAGCTPLTEVYTHRDGSRTMTLAPGWSFTIHRETSGAIVTTVTPVAEAPDLPPIPYKEGETW